MVKTVSNITAVTKKFGIIGYPLKHTFSPLMHNSAFQALGLDAAYLAYEVNPKYLKQAVEGLRVMGVCGFNVTVPHKENVIRYLDELDKQARIIGAVNTVVNKNGVLKGYNTDGFGFVESLKRNGVILKGKDAFMIGAGGAARAVSVYMAKEKIKSLTIADIDRLKLRRLLSVLKKNFPKVQFNAARAKLSLDEQASGSDIVINATPYGMKKGDKSLLSKGALKKSMVVYDLIYNPAVTPLLKVASFAGATTINGSGMLLYQGVKAFEIWMGKKAPVEIMRRALNKQLNLGKTKNKI